ncbi:DUF4034 domain-containing protein [Yoonia sp. 2307UL14-13]|uniref:DUF4034 domain-containing protein n=1 Tax=Yoonia sp. 2307UL14-13 TaxID=3126506 RepID=UPI0030AE7A5B
MRVLVFVISLFVSSLPVDAAVTGDDIRALAYRGDVDGLERSFAEAHRQSLTGDLAYDDLRDLVIALTVSHPTIWDTTSAWIEAYPQSPYAHALRAFQYNTLSWNIRGSGPARGKRREALADFSRYQEWAMDHAQMAFDASPDYVPGSDAIFRLQATTKRYSRRTILSMISIIMQVQPNIGSLKRASTMTQQGWGGRGQRDIILLCEEHADKVPDDSYDADICIYHLTRQYWARDEEYAYADQRLGDKAHPAIERVQAFAITTGRSGRRSAEDARIVENYLRGAGYRDYDMAQRYLATFPQNRLSQLTFISDIANAAIEHARAEIAHDPLNPDLLDVLERRSRFFVSVDHDYPYDFKSPNGDIIDARRAAISRYNADEWLVVARNLSGSKELLISREADPYFTNGVYYSDHSYSAMRDMLHHHYDAWRFAQHDGEIGPYLHEDRQTVEYWMCPVVRLTRLLDAKCEADHDAEHCPVAMLGFRAPYRGLLDEARKNDLCSSELQSTIADLRFSPMPVAMDYALEPLVFE